MAWFKSEEERVADELQALQAEYRRLARQLESHAELAPYPHVAERLQRLLDAEERNARTVAERLAALGRHPRPNGIEHVRGGRNSWERLVATLEDYRALERRFTSLYVRWDDEHPEDAALVRSLRDLAAAHRETIADLIARSDPHATN